MLIIMYKYIITELKIPALYIPINSKIEIIYDLIFESLIRILVSDKNNSINFEIIITDQEIALIKVVKNIFQIIKEFHAYSIINKIYWEF